MKTVAPVSFAIAPDMSRFRDGKEKHRISFAWALAVDLALWAAIVGAVVLVF
jgi:hypothetical protein